MNQAYEGPVGIRKNSNNSYDGDETLLFPDGSSVELSRDMHDTRGGSIEWDSEMTAGDMTEHLMASNEHEERVLYGDIEDGLVYMRASPLPDEGNEMSIYSASAAQGGMGRLVVKVIVGNRSSHDAAVLDSIETTALPTVAGRSGQILDIFGSR